MKDRGSVEGAGRGNARSPAGVKGKGAGRHAERLGQKGDMQRGWRGWVKRATCREGGSKGRHAERLGQKGDMQRGWVKRARGKGGYGKWREGRAAGG
eukprot:366355-Chlamydomonas_euryale.AAC.6